MNTVQEYYTNQYDEDKRLGEKCDNRHKVEIINKGFLITAVANIFDSKTSIRIIDVGAGTGYWTDFMLHNYNNVEIYCGDLVEKHNDILRERFKEYRNVHVVPMDALNINRDMYGEFDIVLCGGPLYHLDNEHSQIVSNNLLDICNSEGYILVDWLSEASGIINWTLMERKPIDDNIENVDKMFHYKTTPLIDYLFSGHLTIHFGIDSISRFVAKDINKFNMTELEIWCKNIRKHWRMNADLSEHSISVIVK